MMKPSSMLASDLRSLISKATDEELRNEGRYFEGTCNDLTQCRHNDTGEYSNPADGRLVEWLWNRRHEILAMIEAQDSTNCSGSDAVESSIDFTMEDRSFPQAIGKMKLGERLSDGEVLCATCWDESDHNLTADTHIPPGYPVYFDEPHHEEEDCDSFCINHAIEALSHDTCIEAPFQLRVLPWLLACFGLQISSDRLERNDRFIEEALELVQATGYSVARAHQLVDYVFGRPTGVPHQEVGGVMVTLAALCLANNLDMHEAGEAELSRILEPTIILKIRAKQAAKPSGSALPIPLSIPA